MSYTEGIESPAIFRKWAGIGTLSAALRRNTYVQTRSGKIFPNLYIIFVAPPGVGKSLSIDAGRDLLTMLRDVNILPSVISGREQLYVELQNAITKEVLGREIQIESTGSAFPDELGTFIKRNDFEFLQALTKLYDCPTKWDYATKHSGTNLLENVGMTIIGGTQPETLRKLLPDEAFGMGFAARLILIYSDEKIETSLFGGYDPKENEQLKMDLVNDLEIISKFRSKLVFHKDAVEFLEGWNATGLAPTPPIKLLESYNTRRRLHLFKLCQICAVSENAGNMIRLEHAQMAKELMLEAERDMPGAFSAMSDNQYLRHIQDAYLWVLDQYNKKKVMVPEYKLRHRLLTNVPIYMVKQIMDEYERSGLLKFMGKGEGNRMIQPGKSKEQW